MADVIKIWPKHPNAKYVSDSGQGIVGQQYFARHSGLPRGLITESLAQFGLEEGSSKISGPDMAGSGETRGYTSEISVLLRGLPDERGIVQFLNLKTQ